MGAGNRRFHVRIDRATTTKDAAGKRTLTWVTHCSPWAARRPLSSRESASAGQIVAINAVAYEMPYDSLTAAITPGEGFRLVDGAHKFDIRGVPPATFKSGPGTVTLICEARTEAAA